MHGTSQNGATFSFSLEGTKDSRKTMRQNATTLNDNLTQLPGWACQVDSTSLYGFTTGSLTRRQASSAIYQIDGSRETIFGIPGSKPSPTNSSVYTAYYDAFIFTTPDLDPGTHEITITFTGVQSGSDPLQWLIITVDVTASDSSPGLDSGSGALRHQDQARL
ncbi:hypothetical protein WG66_010235 [Moniliophthora roreri]|uniref:Uncharacterized protein n=1 Tax=Moniliophthora roreri TaxID=221103 RepID=A0A0W0F7D2_MONRR|nr:hypothetical protein WG66_010235 [Moniliophthora roreri]